MRVVLSVLALVLASASAWGADLTKIDRTPPREPAYRNAPRYCLLVFGPEAKIRVWLVHDGDAVYIDRNGNGDLTEKDERVPLPRFFKSIDPSYLEQREVALGDVREGELTHTRLSLSEYRPNPDAVVLPAHPLREQMRSFGRQSPGVAVHTLTVAVERRPKKGDRVRIAGRYWQRAGQDADGFLQFAVRPADAPIVPFNGPLRMGLLCDQALKRGEKPGDLFASVGTPGVGRGTFAHVELTGLILEDEHPVAEIEFPPAASGKEGMRRKVTLPYRFEVSHPYGPVAVPAEAGEGKARVRLSFAASENVPVGPAEVDVAMEPAPRRP
jgi:hypothetical protein